MGNTATRRQMARMFERTERPKESTESKLALAGYLEALSDMVDMPSGTGHPERRLSHDELGSVRVKLKKRLAKQSSHDNSLLDEDIQKQLDLLDDLESQDDTTDWASMRAWLVWCLQSNLDESETELDSDPPLQVTSTRGRCVSQSSVESVTSRRRQSVLSRQVALDIANFGDRCDSVTQQSSLESNGET